MDWAARVTTGRPWPDGRPNRPGPVILLAAEDDFGSTVMNRFRAAGGDPSKLLSIGQGGASAPFSLDTRLSEVEEVLWQHPGVRLIVIDPLSSYLPGVNTGQDNSVRAALGPLAALAARHQVAVVCVTHLVKSGRGAAMYRSLGGIGFQGLARQSWMVAPRPGSAKDAKLLLSTKSNLAKTPRAIGFTVVGAPGRPSVSAHFLSHPCGPGGG